MRLFRQLVKRCEPLRRYVSNGYRSALADAGHLLGPSSQRVSLLWALNQDLVHADLNLNSNHQHPLIEAITQVDREKFGLVALLFARLLSEDGRRRGAVLEPPERLLIEQKQLLLAQTVEAIEGGCLLHSKVNTDRPLPEELGEKLADRNAISAGSNLIFHRASRNLLRLADPVATAPMHTAIQNFVEGEFLLSELIKKISDGDPTTNFVEIAEKIKYLKYGSLLGNSCKSMVYLYGQNDNKQQAAFEFGRNFASALETFIEVSMYDSDLTNENIELRTPLLFALEERPELAKLIVEHQNCCLMASKLHQAVLDSSAIDKTSSLLHMYSRHSISALDRFENTEAKAALLNVINSFRRS